MKKFIRWLFIKRNKKVKIILDYFKPGYYVPLGFQHLLNPEEHRILDELPENKKCEECDKTIWICHCMIDAI